MKMTRQHLHLFWAGCLTFLLTLIPSQVLGADAKPPEKMAFQGFLTDQNGTARGLASPENIEITFRLYKSPTALPVDAVWAEKQTVTVDKGHFSIVLGEGVLVSGVLNFPAHFGGNDTDGGRYLGITVTGETEISPRIQFFTAPYSFLSRYATELVGSSGTSVLKVGVDKVGINLVGAPSTALDVNGIVTSTGQAVNGDVEISGNRVLELGAGVAGKQGNAGKIGYATFTAGTLDIVGAGTSGSNRKVKIFAEGGLTVAGSATLSGAISATDGDFSTVLAGTLQADGRTTSHSQGGYLEWNKDAGTGMTYLLNQKGLGAGGIVFGEVSTGDVITEAARIRSGNMAIGTGSTTYARFMVAGSLGDSKAVQIDNREIKFRGDGDTHWSLFANRTAGTFSIENTSSGAGSGVSGTPLLSIHKSSGVVMAGPLNVGGVAYGTFQLEAYLDFNGAANTSQSRSDLGASIVSDNRVRASAFDVKSDRRIKNVIARSEGSKDLAMLKRIEITDFTFKDAVSQGNRPQKKVIAQQVEEVFPQAITRFTDVVPDIFQKAPVEGGWVKLKTDLKKGDRVQLMGTKGRAVHQVVEVVEKEKEARFRVEPEPNDAEVFVYGREVTDFRAVDYEAIAMLNVSATQELARQLATKEAELDALRAELAKARGEKETLAESLSAMDSRLFRLEKILKQQAVLAPVKPDNEVVQVDHTRTAAGLAK